MLKGISPVVSGLRYRYIWGIGGVICETNWYLLNCLQLATLRPALSLCKHPADVAQLVEQLTRNEQVVRSIRIIGSSFPLPAARLSPPPFLYVPPVFST